MFSSRRICWIASALLVAVVSSSASGIEDAAASDSREPSAEPYAFSYSAESVGGYSDRQESGDASGRVQGFYTMMGDDGRMRRVDYVADENGYRARISTNEMGTRTGPTGDAMYSVSQPSPGQLEAARVTAAQYAALESPHLLAAGIGNARMTLTRDDDAWRSRLQAEPVIQQQQQPWRFAPKPSTSGPVQDLTGAEETNLARQAIPSYQSQQQRLDRRPNTNGFPKVNDLRQIWADGGDIEQQSQQQSNIVDAQDQVEITTTTEPTTPIQEPKMTVKSRPNPLPVKEQTSRTELPTISITAGQEQVDLMIQTTSSGTTSTTTEQPTTTSTTMTTTTVQEQESPTTTTKERLNPTSLGESQEPLTQEVTITTKQLQTTPVVPATTPQVSVTSTSQGSTTESPTTITTTVTRPTRQPIVIIETNRAALMEQPRQQQQEQVMKQWSQTGFGSAKVPGWKLNNNGNRKSQQNPTKSMVSFEESQVFVAPERSTRPPVVQIPIAKVGQQQQQQTGSFVTSANGTKGGSSKTGSRQQAFWRSRMLRSGQISSNSQGTGELTGFGARTNARQVTPN